MGRHPLWHLNVTELQYDLFRNLFWKATFCCNFSCFRFV